MRVHGRFVERKTGIRRFAQEDDAGKTLRLSEWEERGDAGGVVVEFLAKGFSEKFFLGTDADLIADQEESDRDHG